MHYGFSFLLILLAGCAGTQHARRSAEIGLEWVQIPGARYVMGDTFEEKNADALPLHHVTVAPFELSRYETTYAQYDAYARDVRVVMPAAVNDVRGNRAVSGVDWDQAVAFCQWLGGRLPSEQEWELAAAGGANKQLYAGTDEESEVDQFVRHIGNSTAAPGHVGRKEPNRFGLYDMSGNVGEWIGSYYQFYPEDGESPSFNDLEVFGIRIVRGGSYSMDPEVTRTYWRAGTLREVRSPAVGFRCAKDL